MPVYTYTTIDDPLATQGPNQGTAAQDIDSTGQIIGWYRDVSGYHGFLLSGGKYTTFDDPSAANFTTPHGINNIGQIVGSYGDSGGFSHGFLLSNGLYAALDDPDPSATNGTFASGINDMGQIVGNYQTATGFRGFLLSGGLYLNLDDPSAGPLGTIATGINTAGQIVGRYTDNSGAIHGFLYNPNGGTYTTLDDPLAAHGTIATASTTRARSLGSTLIAIPWSTAFCIPAGLTSPSTIP
jgi:probable HAF family extracellular repeat protein